MIGFIYKTHQKQIYIYICIYIYIYIYKMAVNCWKQVGVSNLCAPLRGNSWQGLFFVHALFQTHPFSGCFCVETFFCFDCIFFKMKHSLCFWMGQEFQRLIKIQLGLHIQGWGWPHYPIKKVKKGLFYQTNIKKGIFFKRDVSKTKKRAPDRNDTTTEHRGWIPQPIPNHSQPFHIYILIGFIYNSIHFNQF